jgi:hypothetical protein
LQHACDFKTLPMEKEAIVDRVKEELEKIKVLKSRGEKAVAVEEVETLMREVYDRMEGVKIMVMTLKDDFNMDSKEMMQAFELKGMSVFDSIRLAMKVKHMEKVRGVKHGR